MEGSLFLKFQSGKKCHLIDSETYQIAQSEKGERTQMTALCNGLGATDQSCTVRYGTSLKYNLAIAEIP